MGMLSAALRKYYRRSGNRLIFGERYSLNGLSLRMWEVNGYNTVDPSILSKGFSGKRLLTPAQLQTFCEILNIPKEDREYLFYCMHRDALKAEGISIEAPFVSATDMDAFIDGIYASHFASYFNGDCKSVFQHQESTMNFLHVVQRRTSNDTQSLVAKGAELLFLQAWASSCVLSAEDALARLMLIKKRLSEAQGFNDKKTAAFISYIDMLHGYVSAEYAGADAKTYADVVKYGLQVLSTLDDVDHIVLAARKTIIGATRIEEHKIVEEVAEHVMDSLQRAGGMRNSAGLALMKNSMENSLVHKKSRFVERTVTELDTYAHEDFIGKHTYTMSNMKDRIELAVTRRVSLKDLRTSMKRALIVSEEEGFIKQRNKILQAVRKHEPSMLSSLSVVS